MPKFLEKKLKAEYGKNSSTPYKVMNSMGAMRGNKETAKGAAMQKKHDEKQRLSPKAAADIRLRASRVNRGSGY